MFRWALTDPFPINAARLRAYFPLPPAIAAEVIGDFERELACRGDPLLRLTRSPQHSSKLFEVRKHIRTHKRSHTPTHIHTTLTQILRSHTHIALHLLWRR